MNSSHLQVHSQLAQVLHEVVSKRIIVVQNQNHVSSVKVPYFLENKSENEFGSGTEKLENRFRKRKPGVLSRLGVVCFVIKNPGRFTSPGFRLDDVVG
jgi:hypothetical protein